MGGTKMCLLSFNVGCVNIQGILQIGGLVIMNIHGIMQIVMNFDVCDNGYIFSKPTDGYQNAKLQVEWLTKYIWINVNVNHFEIYRIKNNMKWYTDQNITQKSKCQ